MKGKTHDLIHQHLVQKHGQVYADSWLRAQAPEKGRELPPLTCLSTLAKQTPHSEALRSPLSSPDDFFSPTVSVKSALAPLSEPLDAKALTQKLTACLEDDLSKSQLKTFRLLHTVALTVAQKRGYAPSVSSVTFFCPAEVIAYALGIHRTTLWRHLQPMLELGLLDVRGHKTTHRGQTLSDGSLWCIRLHPRRGKAPRLRYDELKASYRDLGADIDAGRTAYALTRSKMQQSNTLKEETQGLKEILAWTLTPLTYSSPVSSDCCKTSVIALESVLDVRAAAKPERNEAVNIGAKAIVSALGDVGSHRFYCKLLWNLLRRHDQGQDYFFQVYEMILRARADSSEGFARSAGALFVSRLKKWEVWDWLEDTPMTRVGIAQSPLNLL